MKKIYILIIAGLLFFYNMAYADKYIRIAAIDFEYIFKKYTATKNIRRKLASIRKKISKEIRQKKRNLKSLIYLFNREKNRLSDLERRWRLSEIEINKAKLIERIRYLRRRLKRYERRISMPFITEIFLAARKISKKYGFLIVIDKKNILSVDARHDISKAVLGFLERRLRGYHRE